jgi:hypothetical protein
MCGVCAPSGSPNSFPIPFKTADIDNGGLHFNLYNNIWGTKYVISPFCA